MAFDVDKIAEVHRKIDWVLLKEWDPIGVADEPQAQDEYRDYCRAVYDVAVKTGSAQAFAELLIRIEKDRMGFTGTRSGGSLLPIGQKIIDLVATLK